jgi:hypothetical protein
MSGAAGTQRKRAHAAATMRSTRSGLALLPLIDGQNEGSIAVAERLGLAHERDVLQKGVNAMRLYALEARRVPLRR